MCLLSFIKLPIGPIRVVAHELGKGRPILPEPGQFLLLHNGSLGNSGQLLPAQGKPQQQKHRPNQNIQHSNLLS